MTVKYLSSSSRRKRWFLRNLAVGFGFMIPGLIFAYLITSGVENLLIFFGLFILGVLIVHGLHWLIDQLLFTTGPITFGSHLNYESSSPKLEYIAAATALVAFFGTPAPEDNQEDYTQFVSQTILAHE